MSSSPYQEKLARAILQLKKTHRTSRFASPTKDTEFEQYADDYIEVVGAVNTKALRITIFKPLTDAASNPVMMINDEGQIYRTHGEGVYFSLYAEKLLGLPQKTFLRRDLQERELEILHLNRHQERLKEYAVAIYNQRTENVTAHVVYG